ncbi:MAG: hypothetical protein AAFW47_00460 [Pseudomonadota bacterium]
MDGRKLILLAMSDVDAEFFARALRPHAEETVFLHIRSLEELTKAASAAPQKTRLLSFCSPHIVPGHILDRLSGNCYNFHPGPPERPGYMPAPFALADKAKDYGVTFHHMEKTVDTGFIIDVARFSLSDTMNQHDIEVEAYKALLEMVVRRGRELANIDFQFQPSGIGWTGTKTTKQDLKKLQNESVS